MKGDALIYLVHTKEAILNRVDELSAIKAEAGIAHADLLQIGFWHLKFYTSN